MLLNAELTVKSTMTDKREKFLERGFVDFFLKDINLMLFTAGKSGTEDIYWYSNQGHSISMKKINKSEHHTMD